MHFARLAHVVGARPRQEVCWLRGEDGAPRAPLAGLDLAHRAGSVGGGNPGDLAAEGRRARLPRSAPLRS
eukprot:4531999-Pyramimonas_sp.AAC.1